MNTVGCFHNLDLSPNRIERTRRRIATGKGYIDLTSSNPTQQGLLFPPDLLRTAANTYWDNRRYEPDPCGLLIAREAISRYYSARTPALQIPSDAIIITANTSEAYSLLFALLTDPGDNVLAPNVTYPLFDYLAAIHRIELRPYTLNETHGWQIDTADLFAQANERTRAILLISPHNPTGAIFQTALPALDQLGLPLICDEVFAPFTYNAATTPPIAALHQNLPIFMLNSISKLLALPDLKLSWIALNPVAQTTALERLELLNDTFLSANSVTQTMLPMLLEHGQYFVTAMVSRVRANIDLALDRCADSSALVLLPPDGGYYLFPSVRGWEDEEDLVVHLLEHGVLVYPGFFYGDVPGTHVMLSALTEPTQFAQGIERLHIALHSQTR